MSRLVYVMRGIKKHQARNTKGGATCLPITPGILQKLKTTWETSPLESPKDAIMLWAACCLAFFGFLRLAECTVPNDRDFDPQDHLTLQDISFHHASSPQVTFVTIKRSKTDPFWQGITLILESVSNGSVLGSARGQDRTIVPICRWSVYLTRQRLVNQLHQALQKSGLDSSKYNGHSFRISAATAAAEKGVEDSMIKTLGWWESSAYTRYIKIPREQLASYTRVLVS